jgi:hypothetical protein
MEWLIKNYGRILPHQAIENRQKLTAPWNISEPFQVLNDRFQRTKEFAQDYGVPIPDADLLTYGIYHIQNTGALTSVLKKWNDKPLAHRTTWTQFVAHFQPEILEYQLTKPNQNHFAQMASASIEATIQPILHCFEAQQKENSQSMANMVHTNSSLLQQLESMKQQLAALSNKIEQPSGNHTIGKPTNHLPPRKSVPRRLDRGSYCHTHGYAVASAHTSLNCSTPADGHKREATRDNTMGGNTWGKGRTAPKTSHPPSA